MPIGLEMILTTSSEAEFIIRFGQPIAKQLWFYYSITASDESESFRGQSLNQWGKIILIYVICLN